MTKAEIISYAKRLVKQAEHVEFAHAVVQALSNKSAGQAPHPCHLQAVGVYKAFLEQYKLPFKMDNRAGKALRAILYMLQEKSATQDAEGALQEWQWLLQHWDVLNEYLRNRKEMTQIYHHIIEIYEKIQHGTDQSRKRTSTNAEQRASDRGTVANFARSILLQSGAEDGA